MVTEVREEMKERRVVVLRDILQKGSLSNVLESVFGGDVSIEREELGSMVKEGFGLIAEFNLDDYFPLRFLDFHGVKRRCCQLAGKVNSVVGQIVKERKGAGDHSRSGSDFLSALLSLPEEDQLNESDMVALLWVKDSPFLLAKS
jgi:hypothetical protein